MKGFSNAWLGLATLAVCGGLAGYGMHLSLEPDAILKIVGAVAASGVASIGLRESKAKVALRNGNGGR